MFIGMLILSLAIVSATEVSIITPYNHQIFNTNDHVMVGVRVVGNPVTCQVKQSSSNKDFDMSANYWNYYFYPKYDAYFWIVNGWDSRDDYFSLDDGNYKIQLICKDTEGNCVKSEEVKFRVKG